MPAYDYQCNACGVRFEKRQKMSDPELECCPSCGGKVKRLIGGGAGIISRGSAHHFPEAGAGCGSGTPCCGQAGGCPNQQFCEQ